MSPNLVSQGLVRNGLVRNGLANNGLVHNGLVHNGLSATLNALGPDAARPAQTQFTRALQARFLRRLADSGEVRVAARSLSVSHQTVYRMRRACPSFRQGWDAALLVARERAEEELATRALHGVEEEVYYHGEVVATRRRYDSRLLLAHLARLDRMAAQADVAALAENFDAVLQAFESHGPESHGPESHGPETHGPESDGPETHSPETHSPESDGPETHSPESDGPETHSPESDGLKTDAPAPQGAASCEAEAPEAEMREPETLDQTATPAPFDKDTELREVLLPRTAPETSPRPCNTRSMSQPQTGQEAEADEAVVDEPEADESAAQVPSLERRLRDMEAARPADALTPRELADTQAQARNWPVGQPPDQSLSPGAIEAAQLAAFEEGARQWWLVMGERAARCAGERAVAVA